MSWRCNHPLGFSATCETCAGLSRYVVRYTLVLTAHGWTWDLTPRYSDPL